MSLREVSGNEDGTRSPTLTEMLEGIETSFDVRHQ